ncbi:MAG: hypothetical protein ABIJ57_10110 [Pseudomonadota bacterium]
MAALFDARDNLGKEIADALGLKHVRGLDFHMRYGSVATVKVEYSPEVDGVKQFPAILKEFELVKKKQIGKVSLPVGDLMKKATCEIVLTGMKTWKARLSLGIVLFKLAAWVMGMKGNINIGDQVLGEIRDWPDLKKQPAPHIHVSGKGLL